MVQPTIGSYYTSEEDYRKWKHMGNPTTRLVLGLHTTSIANDLQAVAFGA